MCMGFLPNTGSHEQGKIERNGYMSGCVFCQNIQEEEEEKEELGVT